MYMRYFLYLHVFFSLKVSDEIWLKFVATRFVDKPIAIIITGIISCRSIGNFFVLCGRIKYWFLSPSSLYNSRVGILFAISENEKACIHQKVTRLPT